MAITKRRKLNARTNTTTARAINTPSNAKENEDHPQPAEETCLPPARQHRESYHSPLLLSSPETAQALLTWFDSVSTTREMPWRKPWTPPAAPAAVADDDSTPLSQRAYEVWVSEIMLQQTRVSTVIPYFTRWITRWPTVHALATAQPSDVLAAWKGLGYYSRATRLHEAAVQIVRDLAGEIPADVDGLLNVKGIGRYTAGAVSSIAFGRAVPVLDGNVARVLSRQMGLYARVKERRVEELLWRVAGRLVEAVSGHDDTEVGSSVPGRWNQGLMELGATVCTPRPRCEVCPVQGTCRAYAEGVLMVRQGNRKIKRAKLEEDIEDVCTLCSPLEIEEVEQAADENIAYDDEAAEEENGSDVKTKSKKRPRAATSSSTLPLHPAKANRSSKISTTKQRTLLDFSITTTSSKSTAFTPPSQPSTTSEITTVTTSKPSDKELSQIRTYCTLFPQRQPKKSIPTEECIVCIVRFEDNPSSATPLPLYLVEQRPNKGLLAALWQFPNLTMKKKTEVAGSEVKTKAKVNADESSRNSALGFVREMIVEAGLEAEGTGQQREWDVTLAKETSLGRIVHVFSHLRLEMEVWAFVLRSTETEKGKGEEGERVLPEAGKRRKWLSMDGVDEETLSKGMERCWRMYTDQEGL